MDEIILETIRPLLKMYEKIENDLLIEIASHFSINEEFLNSDYWRIKKLEEMGLFNQEIIEYIATYSGKTKREIKEALDKIGIKAINTDKLNVLYGNKVLMMNPEILLNNKDIKNIINKAYNELSNSLIQMSYLIEKGTRGAYLSVVEEAYLKTLMGTHSYQEAIKQAINDLSNKGITTLTYKSTDEDGNVVGIRKYDIEGAVRREVLTATRKLANDVSMKVAEELECEYVYLSEHLECRPSHFDWQGTVIKRKDLVSVTGYGEVDSLGGINCRHYFEPYFGNAREDDLKTFSRKDCKISYRKSQMQRYLERGVRKWKRKKEMYKAINDQTSFSRCKAKVKEWQNRNRQFTEENDLRRDYIREHVSKINATNYEDVTKDWLDKAQPNSHKVLDRQFFEDEKGNRYDVDDKNVVLDYSEKEKEVAEWLEDTFGGEIYMMPRVNNPEGISTADYLWNNEYWDLKEIKGKGKRTIDSAIKSKEKQSYNFILDITESKLLESELLKQARKIYDTKGREWIDTIIIKKHSRLLAVYKKRS